MTQSISLYVRLFNFGGGKKAVKQPTITQEQIENYLNKLRSEGKSPSVIAEYQRNLKRLDNKLRLLVQYEPVFGVIRLAT